MSWSKVPFDHDVMFIVKERSPSKIKIFGERIYIVPIYDFEHGFLFRMDVEFIEYHHFPVLLIIEQPFMRLAVRRYIRKKMFVMVSQYLYSFHKPSLSFSPVIFP